MNNLQTHTLHVMNKLARKKCHCLPRHMLYRKIRRSVNMNSAVAVLLLVASVYGIPSSLLEDVKIAKMTPVRSTAIYTPNKVKRSQEVFMYGDQQSHLPITDMNNYQREMRFPRTNKRDLASMQHYSAYPDHRIERTAMKRRSLSRIRAKRDSDIDPRELLPVLLLALSEEKLGMLGKNRGSWNNYNPELDDGEWADNVELNNRISDLDGTRSGGEWLDGPITPSVHQLDVSPSRHWGFKDDDHKRFMVSKRYQNRDEPSIAQLFNNDQPWDYNVPVYRRMIL